ncbi:MAG: LysM peptidoglycan-binding domain-containing protein [Alphaproteobacteria bacterium]|nr:LysM peptidoglycan-binding domain-containing protein [Alphaproteobacteria bacterium]MBN2780300.1 LysM peptidoglycan-binding domain-containing protein [Alphaproteobacteria bacterium]
MENEVKKQSPFRKGLIAAFGLVAIGLLIWAFTGSDDKKEPTSQAEITRPTFDTVRVEKGKAVIAGRAAPDTKVYVLSGDKEIGTEHTDARGEFVFLPEKTFKAGTYELSLFVMKDKEKIVSPHKAVLTIDPKSNETIAILVGTDEAKLLAAPKKEKGAGNVGVTMMEYDFKNKFNINGFGLKDHSVRLYLNNTLLGEEEVDDKGWWKWSGDQKLIQDKRYRLRIDLINQTGKVVARAEHQFSTDVYTGTPDLYSVKKGDCLWRIARRTYGRGIDYVLIFKANKAQIRNPDLIYPNQLFKLPQK